MGTSPASSNSTGSDWNPIRSPPLDIEARAQGPAPSTTGELIDRRRRRGYGCISQNGRFAYVQAVIFAAGIAFALLNPANAADPQKFGDEAKATAFCKAGNVVWFNPASKIYFAPGSEFYGKTKVGGYLQGVRR
jgi:hypothetical protein